MDPDHRGLVERACVLLESDLRNFLRGVLRDRDLADDALQRTMVKGIEAAADVNPQTVKGWLFRIALNEAREIRRTAQRQVRLHRAVWESLGQDSEVDRDTSAEGLSDEDVRQAISRALESLDADYREVVVRRIQQGQTFAVIAEEMNRPLGTVLTWMRRALTELREYDDLRDLWTDR